MNTCYAAGRARAAGAALLLAAATAFAAPVSNTVSYFNLSGGQDGESPASFVASVDAAPGLAAGLADKTGSAAWNDMPAGLDPSQWISLVKVKAGQHCDFFAFRFADRTGTVAFSTHRPSRVREVRYFYAVPPGEGQIPQNAIRETATDFIFRATNEAACLRPALQIVVEPWPAETDGRGAGLGGDPGGAPVRAESVEALAFAAAYEAGWRPTAGPADTVIRLSIREEMSLFYATRATLGSGATAWSRRNIPKEAAYVHLARLFFRLREAKTIAETAAFGSDSAGLVAWTGGAAILADGLVLKAVEPGSGRTLWQVEASEKAAPRYAWKTGPDGAQSLFRYDEQVAGIDPTSGALRVWAPRGAQTPALFDVTAGGDVARIEDGKLQVCQGGAPLWTYDGPLGAAGPVWGAGLVFAADPEGAVLALDPAGKRVAWRTPPGAGRGLRLAVRDGLLLAASDTGIEALELKTGKRRWIQPTGDVLLDDPDVRDGRVTIATKKNELIVLDAATGGVKASRAWPTWLLAARVVRSGADSVVAVVDLKRRLTVLKAEDLSPLRETEFPWALAPVILFGEHVPAAWSLAASGESEELVSGMESVAAGGRPALLVSDVRGFLYAVTLP